eukprot:snap_masked-scaffold_7-processed-gene-18.21-mRNA-1 protein AED:1.00 eAED:1.00 QI:0/-1/0/0/-1/1/1/0/227
MKNVSKPTEVKTSLIPHPAAGNGLFSGKCGFDVGDVISLYPGKIYLPFRVFKLFSGDTEENEISTSLHKVQRYDKCVILADEYVERYNKFYTAHFANHPAKGGTPNCMILPYDVKVNQQVRQEDAEDPFVEKIKSLTSLLESSPSVLETKDVLNYYLEAPTFFNSIGLETYSDLSKNIVPTIALVATQPIKSGEEILVNYRYDPSASSLPDWYHPIDEQTNSRVWMR